ncbi:hypothetical protein PSRA_1634 [Pseudoscardovia radai]|uniref:DUF4236 domain-containing protein n=1 Tax=Pseudoscardovia radai TaxID=987066 RepID=A0A261ERB6_9BIFI|nr:DUF4236 domain-containing protein [Pseudoscardovia radai]OZG49385.1 hypothetical protein PSRA_1634 [Pseudoscardovia radai]
MGIRFRKSFNLGGGFRVNVSKSGIGYSWGTKGFRYTKTARGSKRKTFFIPGTGFSYVSESGKKRSNKSGRARGSNTASRSQRTYPNQQVLTENATSTESVNAADYQPAEYEELLGQMKKALRLDYLSTWLIATVILAAYPVFIVTAIVGVVLKVVVRLTMKVPMEYSFDDEARAAYDDLSAIWMSLNNNKKFWQAVSESDLDGKARGGASHALKRIPVRATSAMPFFVESNVRPFGLRLRKQRVYFLPDKILVVSRTNVGAISYEDADMDFDTIEFVETDQVPSDAKVVDQTWLRVNKNGTPDRRFKDNKQVPVCEYGHVAVTSDMGLHIELMCSNSETAKEMRASAKRFEEFIR